MEHVIVDCETGEERRVALSAEEIAQREAAAEALGAAEDERASQRVADLATLQTKASEDPAFAALLRHLGVSQL